jgi:7-cyano-7-deazaguanine synthase in queuosine biosynthesis
MGEHWRRQLSFVIPVRNPDLWKSDEMQQALTETLGFLSDDLYEFEFVKSNQPLNQPQEYLAFSEDAGGAVFKPDDVALFSGGLDSFAGAVEALAGDKKKLVLVGHHSSTKVYAVQHELVKKLRKKGYEKSILYVPVKVTNANNTENTTEALQRIRSFLFASIGVTVAHILKKQRITFFENGVVSLNLPISGDVLGARATRTTHPRVLRGFERIFSILLQKSIAVENPYQWKTKEDVIQLIKKYGFESLIGETNSCTRPHLWTKAKTHCGVCSQCLDRRFSVLAASLEQNDPESRYMIELLTGVRDKETDVMMAGDYIKFAYEVSGLSQQQFQREYPQIFDAANYCGMSTATEAINNIYEMIKRHAAGVKQVIVNATQSNAALIASGNLPHGSILSMALTGPKSIQIITSRDMTGDIAILKDRLDQLSAPTPEFFLDKDQNRVVFAGNFSIDKGEFTLVNALLPNFEKGKSKGTEIEYMEAKKLAQDMFKGNEQNLRQLISRLHKKLCDHLGVQLGIADPDEFIENKKGEGYRINGRFKQLSSISDFSLPQTSVTKPTH